MNKNIILIIMTIFHLDILSADRISIATYSHFNSENEREEWWKSGNHNKEPIILSNKALSLYSELSKLLP